MKKIFVILILLTTVIFKQSFAKGISNDRASLTSSWSVSSYGFLIFPTILDLDGYVKFAQTKTHAKLQEYIQESLTGFSSLGSTLYSSTDVTVTEEEAYNYALNTYHIMQVAGILIKPISERNCSVNYEFVLTLMSNRLDNRTYSNLQNGIFDRDNMNKFATNPPTETEPITRFSSLIPYGHEDTEPTNCPDFMPIAYDGMNVHFNPNALAINQYHETNELVISAGPRYVYQESSPKICLKTSFRARPFWGWGAESCVQSGTWFNPQTGQNEPLYYRCQTYYIFWIGVDTDCYYAYGCSGCPQHGACNEQ